MTQDHLLNDLCRAIQREAASEPFPIDEEVYREAGRDPMWPILFAGALEAPLAFFGRDLGKDEVARGEPLVGPAGKLVRRGLAASAGGSPDPTELDLALAARGAFLTNTVPYKPPGNKAYSALVKERFRPFVARLLAVHWKGGRVIPLGNEALEWFRPYSLRETFDRFLALGDRRFEEELEVVLVAADERAGTIEKRLRLAPLPHPSPLNQRWYKRFGELLARRLGQPI